MSGALHVSHCHKRDKMPRVQAVCGGVEADIKCDFLGAKQIFHFGGVGALRDKAPFRQRIDYICQFGFLLLKKYFSKKNPRLQCRKF